jgi:hypothetical protein
MIDIPDRKVTLEIGCAAAAGIVKKYGATNKNTKTASGHVVAPRKLREERTSLNDQAKQIVTQQTHCLTNIIPDARST